ncbi:hypothetical protein EXIGLDRAFT_731230 [Exidia glandulosa HHB12029]|uniref:Mid2 domain-containing protein n=1 Tax=Exidia glandulosa HHB12029 TaxID=1314781 RepID=A0A165BY91_EXIGL|nr:hypothetical protein EXIGLDRAFT_731230 [Exidia glandulosa HHB12029]
MRYLASVLLSAITRTFAQSLNALSIGTDVWGIRLVLTRSPEACGPMIMYYNITPVSGAPASVAWPDTAVVHFLTPERAENEWMTWHPPLGEGVFNWTVPLPAGKQIVVRSFNGYREVFTVRLGSSGCGEEGSTTNIKATFNYGTLDSSVFERLVTQTFPSYNITPDDQFSAVEMPSTDNLNIIDVPLGLDVASPVPGTTQAPAVKTTQTSPANSGEHTTSLSAIIGGVCGALVLVVVLFVLVLCLRKHRGRRQQRSAIDPTVSPVPITPGFDSNDASAATSDEKRSQATRLFVPSPKDPNHEPVMAATSTILLSEVLDPDRQAPPTYSQQA